MKTNQLGQSTIEFILTFMFGLGIVFLFVNVSVNYSIGYLVHYATFMASRTYLTVEADGNTPQASEQIASEAALATFKRFKIESIGVEASGVLPGGSSQNGFHINSFSTASSPADALYVGAYTVFERPLSFFQSIAGNTKLKLVSESYLGKEPVRADCWQRTCQSILLSVTGSNSECNPGNTYDFTVFDNGC